MDSSESLGYLVSHLNVSLQNELNERLHRYDLDIKVWPVLFSLWQEEGITQTELSKRCDVASYTMTRLLDHMQAQGMITRHMVEDNRRAFKIYLTDEAKAMEQDVICEAERVNDKFLKELSDEEQDLFMKLLNKINRITD